MAETEKNAGRNHDTLNLYIYAAGVMLLFLDKQGIIREINRKGCEILGYDEDEILDKKFTEIFLSQAKTDQNQLAFLNYIAESKETSGSPEFDITTKNG
ncbi:PAS domain S-box protein [Methanolacinia petrolearia]|uniref:PAS domain S-box protein n=1 Tax=Methanolacinia petrolearia TaxID=54120 RepID=UPI003BABC788